MLFKLFYEPHKPLNGFCKVACDIVKILPEGPGSLTCFANNGANMSFIMESNHGTSLIC